MEAACYEARLHIFDRKRHPQIPRIHYVLPEQRQAIQHMQCCTNPVCDGQELILTGDGATMACRGCGISFDANELQDTFGNERVAVGRGGALASTTQASGQMVSQMVGMAKGRGLAATETTRPEKVDQMVREWRGRLEAMHNGRDVVSDAVAERAKDLFSHVWERSKKKLTSLDTYLLIDDPTTTTTMTRA